MWIVLALFGCAGSLQLILPATGAYNYAIAGIIGGQLTALIVGRRLREDHAGGHIVAGLSLLAGALGGLFWPVAAAIGLRRLFSGGGDGEGSRSQSTGA